MRGFIFRGGCLVVILFFLFSFVQLSEASERLSGSGRGGRFFDLQAHRGGTGRVPPGNILPAFEYALDLEVTTLELDMHLTRDGEIIVVHDGTLSKEWSGVFAPVGILLPDPLTASVEELVFRNLFLDQVQAYRCLLPPDLSKLPGRSGDRGQLILSDEYAYIPTLREVFEFVGEYGRSDKKTDSQRRNAAKVRFNIETKVFGFEEKVVELVREFKFEDRVTVQSFIFSSLSEISRLAPEIETAALDGDPDQVLRETKARVWSPNYKRLSKKMVRQAQKKGLRVIPWTVNDVDSMRKLMKWGVDGIITDYPDILRSEFGGRNSDVRYQRSEVGVSQ